MICTSAYSNIVENELVHVFSDKEKYFGCGFYVSRIKPNMHMLNKFKKKIGFSAYYSLITFNPFFLF